MYQYEILQMFLFVFKLVKGFFPSVSRQITPAMSSSAWRLQVIQMKKRILFYIAIS